MTAKISKTLVIKDVTVYTTILVVAWAFYRFLFRLPDFIEESIVKPIIWLLPIVFYLKKERMGLDSLGITLKNIFPSIYLSIGLGSFFVIEGLLINFLKYHNFNFGAFLGNTPLTEFLIITFVTAFTEEVSFRGYIFGRLTSVLGNVWVANLIQTALWTAIHIPIAFFVWKLNFSTGIIYLTLTAIFGFGSAIIYSRTRNIFGAIFMHVLWEWPIILFR